MSALTAMIRAVLIVMLATAPAFADGTLRVLLADADPELQRAVRTTLAPWKLEVVVETQHPTDATHAQMIGDAQTARFVVWREGGDLVVFDRERGEAEHRTAPAGALDPASAAAAALTVKTLMRLPPPPEEVADTTTPAEPRDQIVAPVTTDDDSGLEIRVQGGVATRVVRAGDGNTLGGRANVAVFVKPSSLPLRLGIAGDVGTETDVQGSGFKGSWSDWSLVALASWSFTLAPRWEIEPYVGGGVLRSMLDGTEGMVARHERETLTALRAGLFVRTQRGPFSVGAVLGFEATPGTPTYTKMGMGSDIFQVPPFALALGLVVAADLGR